MRGENKAPAKQYFCENSATYCFIRRSPAAAAALRKNIFSTPTCNRLQYIFINGKIAQQTKNLTKQVLNRPECVCLVEHFIYTTFYLRRRPSASLSTHLTNQHFLNRMHLNFVRTHTQTIPTEAPHKDLPRRRSQL